MSVPHGRYCRWVSPKETGCQYQHGHAWPQHCDPYGFRWSTSESLRYQEREPTTPLIEQMIIDMVAAEKEKLA